MASHRLQNLHQPFRNIDAEPTRRQKKLIAGKLQRYFLFDRIFMRPRGHFNNSRLPNYLVTDLHLQALVSDRFDQDLNENDFEIILFDIVRGGSNDQFDVQIRIVVNFAGQTASFRIDCS